MIDITKIIKYGVGFVILSAVLYFLFGGVAFGVAAGLTIATGFILSLTNNKVSDKYEHFGNALLGVLIAGTVFGGLLFLITEIF